VGSFLTPQGVVNTQHVWHAAEPRCRRRGGVLLMSNARARSSPRSNFAGTTLWKALRLLANFENALNQQIADRDRIRAELAASK
jgi:hypothetical protein